MVSSFGFVIDERHVRKQHGTLGAFSYEDVVHLLEPGSDHCAVEKTHHVIEGHGYPDPDRYHPGQPMGIRCGGKDGIICAACTGDPNCIGPVKPGLPPPPGGDGGPPVDGKSHDRGHHGRPHHGPPQHGWIAIQRSVRVEALTSKRRHMIGLVGRHGSRATIPIFDPAKEPDLTAALAAYQNELRSSAQADLAAAAANDIVFHIYKITKAPGLPELENKLIGIPVVIKHDSSNGQSTST